MPDIAGAIAAIEQQLAANWTTTRIVYANTIPDDPWPPVKNGTNAPWVLIEVINTTSKPRAVGQPGNQVWLYDGLIHVHVFVPKGYGATDARTYASQIGDIFRNQTFYNAAPGYQVRTLSPMIDGGEIATTWGGSPRFATDPEFGTWFRVTATIPFEYYHRG